MSSMNKVILIGNVGKEPTIRTLNNGDKVVSFSVATSERWTDKSTGEKREKTEWHNVVIFNTALVKVAENYVKKGTKVAIEGQLQTRKWTDQQGNDRYSTEVILSNFKGDLVLLSRSDDAGGGNGERTAPAGERRSSAPKAQQRPQQEIDDDIPF